jgi:hypothetical protein
VIAGGLAALCPSAARAQQGEGGLSLLFPVAPPVAAMQATVAAPTGIYAPWSNPAALADVRRTTGAAVGGSLTAGNVLGLTGATGSSLLGSVSVAGVVLDQGSQVATNTQGIETGKILFRDVYLAATYGVNVTRRLAAGVSLKAFQARIDCSGECLAGTEASASAFPVDVGVIVRLRADSTLNVGAAVRNLGGDLQFKDAAQADPLPTRLSVGARWDVAAVRASNPDLGVSVTADATQALSSGDLAGAAGVELRLRDAFAFRGGISQGGATLSGATIGLAFRQGRLTVDFARYVAGAATDLGTAPTFLGATLRF